MALPIAIATGIASLALVPFYLRRQPQRHVKMTVAEAAASGKRISWVCPALGSLSYLEQQESDVPPVAADECHVAVRAIGLNYADVFMVLGLYEAFNKYLADADGAPAVPGFEFSGEVTAVGAAVTEHAVGDRVYGFCRFGAYRTAVVVRERLLKVSTPPDGAASIPPTHRR